MEKVLTSTELLHEIARSLSTYVPPTEPAQQAYARSERFKARRDQRLQRLGVTIEQERNQRTTRLCQLMNHMYTICAHDTSKHRQNLEPKEK